MPLRPLTHAQPFLLPPSFEEYLPADHPVRFVAAFVDSLTQAAWRELGIAPQGACDGAPAYHPRLLLSVWLYGFMTGVRASRKLETACQERIPFLWLTGHQCPDHNTLWRFYAAHRKQLRPLFKRTVHTAVQAGLVDFAVQAIDGTKLGANAAKARTLDAAHLQALLVRTEAALADLEAQNATGGEAVPARLPAVLADKQRLRDQVEAALAVVQAEEGLTRLNLTDTDAQLMQDRRGFLAGFNGQAMVSPLDPAVAGGHGMLITATEVTPQADDHGQLLPLAAQAAATLEQAAALTLGDGGYHSGAELAACAAAGVRVAIPEDRRQAAQRPDHTGFVYDPDTESYTCPQGQTLTRRGQAVRANGSVPYQARGAVCRACALFGTCTTNRRGRMLERSAYADDLERHRTWMATGEAKAAYRKRKQIVEPVFGIVKEQLDGRRLLLRGLAQVRAEWQLLATAFNLRTLARLWAQGRLALPQRLLAA